MTLETEGRHVRPDMLETASEWLFRLVSILCLAFGILYWVRLIGMYPGANWRFDLMPIHWQIAGIILAVIYPFAASGLWMLASWGPVIWFACAGTEVIMHVGMPELFGTRDLLIGLHIAVASIYLALRLTAWYRARKAAA